MNHFDSMVSSVPLHFSVISLLSLLILAYYIAIPLVHTFVCNYLNFVMYEGC